MFDVACSRTCGLLFVLLGAGVLAPAEAQSLKRNAVHVEALGPGIIGSANYERFLSESLSMRAGVGFFPGLDWSAVLSPVLLNGFLGRSARRVELGAGAVLWYRIPSSGAVEHRVSPGFLSPALTGTLAYRLQGADGGVYRVGFTPVLTNGKLFPTVALSVGAGF